MDMTKEQEQHLEDIKNEFLTAVDIKYRKGQEEHGGDLADHNELWLVNAAIDETIDQYVYLYTLREKIRKTIYAKLDKNANKNSSTRKS